MVKLQEQMVETLMRQDLDAQQKLQLISGPQQRFDKLKMETNTLSGLPSKETGSSTPSTDTPIVKEEPEPKEVKKETAESGLDVSSLKIQKNFKERALNLMKTFSDSKGVISRNDNNELVVNGKPVQGSNFNELYTALFTPSASATRVGMSELLAGMRQLGLTKSEIVSGPIKKAFNEEPERVGKDLEVGGKEGAQVGADRYRGTV